MEKRGTVDGVAKRRAGRACALCRSRKVRCDVVCSGSPMYKLPVGFTGVHRPSKQAP